jgi:hypothetical protein
MDSLTRLVGYSGWLVGCYYALLVGLRLSKSSWGKYFPGLRSSTEKSDLRMEQALEAKRRLLSQIQHDRTQGRPSGYARLFGTFLSVLIVSWVMTGWLAVRDHRQIATLEIKLAKYEATVPDTWTNFNVLTVYDPWNFQVQWASGGPPFDIKFKHDGSELKLGWDVGMTITLLKFVNTPEGMSVAAHNLGMIVRRYPHSPKFVDWREGQ